MKEPAVERAIQRFTEACEAEARVLAAFVSGSRATGTADEWSDLDLCLIARDENREALWAERAGLIGQLGELVFLEDFDGDETAYFWLADGTEAELTFAGLTNAAEAHRGPYRALLDRDGILPNIQFIGARPAQADQREVARRQIQWFWHDLSHFVTAVGRGQPFWAAGQLQALREYTVNISRLVADPWAPADGFDKVDSEPVAEDLATLAPTFVGLELQHQLAAARLIVDAFRHALPDVVERFDITYPRKLESLLLARLARLNAR